MVGDCGGVLITSNTKGIVGPVDAYESQEVFELTRSKAISRIVSLLLGGGLGEAKREETCSLRKQEEAQVQFHGSKLCESTKHEIDKIPARPRDLRVREGRLGPINHLKKVDIGRLETSVGHLLGVISIG